MSKSIVATCPKCTHEFLFKTVAKRPRPHCPKCSHWFYVKDILTHNTQKKKVHVQNSANFDTSKSTGDIVNAVNDPVRFVTSIITEELMKTRDVRWATLFVSVLRESKKLDYSTQKEIEWSNQAKSLSVEELVEKVAIKGSTSKNISRRLERADDTSPYDNFSDV